MRKFAVILLLGISVLFCATLVVASRHSLLLVGFLSVPLVLCLITAYQLLFTSQRTPWLWFWYRRVAFWLFTIAGRNPLCASRSEGVLYAKAAEHYPMYAAINKALRLVESDREGRMLWDTPLGDFWIPKGASREWLIALLAEQLQNAYKYDRQISGDRTVVFDCGANVGDFSRLALNNGASMVVAIEPSPETAICLRRNLADAIADGRAIVYEGGVWDCNAKLYLETANVEVPGSHCLTVNADLGKHGAWVKLTTIDAIVDELKLDRVNFIKMDVEGAEQKALLGAAHTIKLHKPRLAIATEHTDDRLANAKAVLGIVKGMQPTYVPEAVSSVIVNSPLGYLIAPEVILFDPPRA